MKFSHACDHCTIDPCYFLIQGIGNQQSSFHPSVPKGDYHLSISTLGGRENYSPPREDYRLSQPWGIIISHDTEGLSLRGRISTSHYPGDYNSDRGLCPSLPWGIITPKEEYHLSPPWGIITQTEDYHPSLPWEIITPKADYHPSLPWGIITQTKDYHPSPP